MKEAFEFGANWTRFSLLINDERIQEAERSLKEFMGVTSLSGKSFLDAGCGSGIFSLAAQRLGASRVVSFDYDSQCVACVEHLKKTHDPQGLSWTIQSGSVLDTDFLKSLGQFDVVYSWGVLHHTGAMWQALRNVLPLVRPHGSLYIAIYNDQDGTSRRWTLVKKLYNRCPKLLRGFILVPSFVYCWGPIFLHDLLKYKNPFYTWIHYSSRRGMSAWITLVDWVGGYPFEVAKPEQIFDFYRQNGFVLEKLKTCGGGLGCNEYLFQKI